MRETNVERLERIKALKESYRLKCLVVSTESELVYSPDMEWLIEQAERVQVLEESIKAYALAVEIYSEMPVKEAMEKLTKWAEEEFG